MGLSIRRFCDNTYLCLHYKVSNKKMKKYNLYYKNRILMIKIWGDSKAKFIMDCADTFHK